MVRSVGPYTPVVRAGEFLFVSGQLGLSDGRLVDGVGAQLRQAIVNLEALLVEEGASLSQVVKTTVFLADIADYPAMNEQYISSFADHRPARSAVAVAGLPLGAVVEIEAVAWLSSGDSARGGAEAGGGVS